LLAIAGTWMHPVARISCRDAKMNFVATKISDEQIDAEVASFKQPGENEDDV
jgi:hypothetical protein